MNCWGWATWSDRWQFLNKDVLTEYLNNIFLEKVKTIMIFDDQSKSPTFKKYKQ